MEKCIKSPVIYCRKESIIRSSLTSGTSADYRDCIIFDFLQVLLFIFLLKWKILGVCTS